MKTIPHFFCLVAALLSCAVFSSCELKDNDINTLQDNINTEGIFSTLGTVEVSGNYIAIESDRYDTLVPDNPETIVAIGADSTGQRVVAGFVFLEKGQWGAYDNLAVHIVDLLYKVPTLCANDLREDMDAVFGNDPLQIVNVTLSKKHLNIQYGYYGSAETGHRVNLVLTDESVIGTDGLLPVEFRHDAGKDTGNTYFESIVSFTLESISGYGPDCNGFDIIYNDGGSKSAEWKALKDAG